MRLFYCLLACAAIARAASDLAFTDASWTVVTGVPFEITWKGNTGAVKITLQNGTTANPNYVNVIASGITSNSYSWTPGIFAIPGKSFFLSITDSSGAEAFGDKFTVAATTSTTTSSAPRTSASSTASKVSKTATASSTQSTSSSTSTGTAVPASNVLSTGAKAGIGVGVALGVCLIGGLLAMAIFWRRRYKAVATNDGSGSSVGLTTAGQSEKKGGFFGFGSFGSRKPAPETQLHELPTSNATRGEVQELDGTVRHELQ